MAAGLKRKPRSHEERVARSCSEKPELKLQQHLLLKAPYYLDNYLLALLFAHFTYMLFYIIDDHKMIAQFVTGLLEKAYPDAVIRMMASTSDLTETELQAGQPDLIICDILLSKINGLDAMLQLKKQYPLCNIIMLSSLTDPAIIKQALRNGINGYVCKDAATEEILEAVQMVLAGDKFVSASAKNAMVQALFYGDEQDLSISSREKDVLLKICAGKTPKEISGLLNISVHTVNQHIKNMLRKLKLNRTTDLVVFAIKNKLYFPEQ